jgi:predicted helicase
MQVIPKTALAHKFAHELWTNEIMLLPYYVGCMNIEHAFFEATGQYQPFPGACLVDTFETAETTQHEFGFMSAENTERVKRQKKAPIFVVISNPPYNAWQANENDNNKNRKYAEVDRWVADTYAADSKASNKNSLSDPYVKAIRWASNRIGQEGIVAFVTNNGFIDGIACDGMRKHLAQDFDEIYALDLTGNVRKNPKLSGTTHNVFGIQVGVSINFFVRKKGGCRPGRIFCSRTDEFWRKEQKYHFLNTCDDLSKIEWKQVRPDKDCNWLTEGMSEDFASFPPLGSKQRESETIFSQFSNGVKTNRDSWAWNFSSSALASNIRRIIEVFNDHLARWQRRKGSKQSPDDFVTYDSKIAWSETLKNRLTRGAEIAFNQVSVRRALYRPFTQQWLYFNRDMAERLYQFPSIFPIPETETQNQVICVPGPGNRQAFGCFATNKIAALDLGFEKARCFPFYTYAEDGTDRHENVTDWALEQFRHRYPPLAPGTSPLSKWDIFYYAYAVLHHPQYREHYAANLRRALPRIPFAPDFHAFAAAGKQLADLHICYEQAKEYPLTRREKPDTQLNWRVEKMKLTRDKTSLICNDFLTLEGIPPETYEYRLGNRSALEWVIDQYQVSTDKRSGITNDPNRPDDPQYIVRLIGQVITVSLETVKTVNALPPLLEGAAAEF